MSSARILQRLLFFNALLVCCGSLWASERSFVTKHETEIAGHKIPYVASVEEFIVNNKAGHPALSLFTTSYVAAAASKGTHRPVVFLFNGGPSDAAIGVHMQFGPEQEEHGAQASPNAPTRFAHNPFSLLDVADLVAFDPRRPASAGF